MSEKQRQKKDGQDAGKKRQRMRAAVSTRQANAAPARPTTDEVDKVKYKKGSGGDRQQRPEARHQAR